MRGCTIYIHLYKYHKRTSFLERQAQISCHRRVAHWATIIPYRNYSGFAYIVSYRLFTRPSLLYIIQISHMYNSPIHKPRRLCTIFTTIDSSAIAQAGGSAPKPGHRTRIPQLRLYRIVPCRSVPYRSVPFVTYLPVADAVDASRRGPHRPHRHRPWVAPAAARPWTLNSP